MEVFLRYTGAAMGSTGILLAAFGAHGLEKIAAPGGMRWFAIGCAIQLLTAPMIWVTSSRVGEGRLAASGPLCLVVGVLLFSGTLYAMSLGAPRFLGAVTPLGGLALALGWALLAF